MTRRALLPLSLLALAACVAHPVTPTPPVTSATVAAPSGSAPSGEPAIGQVRGQNYAAATESEPATRAAMAAMARGGSAADGMIAAAITAGLMVPVSSGIGGGGFAMIWDAKARKATILDFRETAPAAFDAVGFEKKDAPKGTSVGVPGEVAGLIELHKRLGKLPFASLVEPVARQAEEGFAVPTHMARMLAKAGKFVAGIPQLMGVFFPGGGPLGAGAIAKNPALGATLRIVAQRGAAGFYEGAVARSLVAAVRKEGGALSEEDLKGYKIIEREPLRATWGDAEVLTMPPPSAGGVMLLETLGMFSPAEAAALLPSTAEGAHSLGEVFRAAFADRVRAVGDPEKNKLDIPALLAPARLAKRRAAIDPNRTTKPSAFVQEDHGTSHFVVADAEGNVVSLTTTVNNPFGARFTAEETGVLLNDELHDFATHEQAARIGVAEPPGGPKAGARPPSSMTPTLVLRGGVPVLTLGGSGGFRIATGVTQVTLGVLAQGLSAGEAVRRPRVHVVPDGSLLIEAGSIAPEQLKSLAARGEAVREEENMSGIQALFFGRSGGSVTLEPAADPRKFGLAEAK
jgi:gamma-glutamyltranspeptidase/glutathione hydrolase